MQETGPRALERRRRGLDVEKASKMSHSGWKLRNWQAAAAAFVNGTPTPLALARESTAGIYLRRETALDCKENKFTRPAFEKVTLVLLAVQVPPAGEGVAF